ncbi:MAG: ABC transporter permease [Cyclobacteriaceae bacterium]|nr:ABC transporter permease [Cyclobacteriaceae bacterium]
MVKHYLLLVYRNFLRAKSYFTINLVGLSTGLACTLLIFLWVSDELSMNKFHEKDARLYQIMEHQMYADGPMTTTSTPGLLAETLKAEFPEVEYAATTTWVNNFTLSINDHSVKAKGWYVGPEYFQIFSFPLLQGTADQVLKDDRSIVISRSLARKLFKDEADVLGKTVELQHDKSYQVSGVFEDLPATSSIQFEFTLSFEDFKKTNDWVLEWGNNGPSTYVVFKEGTDAAAFSEKIKNWLQTKNKETNTELFAYHFSDRYLHGRFENGKQVGGRIEYVQLFSIIAIFILLIACINFMNLSTARATRKAKEVGIKKSVGAQRGSLILQFLSESVVVTLVSVLFSLVLVMLLLPKFNEITDKKIQLSLLDPQLLGWAAAITVVTGILAGSYPAFYLSGFRPASVLKGNVSGSWGELWARKGLVVFQFFLSVILIVSVLVIYRQIEFAQTKNLGYDKDRLIQIYIEGKLRAGRETFLTELRRVPGVAGATSIGNQLLGRNNNTSGLEWEGKDPETNILFENVAVNYGTIETLGIEMAEGRAYSEEFGADTTKIIFNQAGIEAMGMVNPIGKHIKLWGQYDLEIIGVVKNFHYQSLHEEVAPLFFRLSPRNTWTAMVRLEGGREKEALEGIQRIYSTLNPGFAFEYQWQDQEYGKLYAAEQRVASLSFSFATMAIVISCLGLFGLATFTAERRTKEIGIRKALGSSSTSIVVLLSADFTRMVLLSIGLGLPASYWLLKQWLDRFAFHIDLGIGYFALAGALALVIAWLTVASQAIRASNVNPVNCLREN